jgi:hypothetical protein
MTQPAYIITVRSLPNARTAPEQRLKAVLKRLLRSYQFRCLECVEVRQDRTALVQPAGRDAERRAEAMKRYLEAAP